MNDRMCIEEYLQRFDRGEFDSPDVDTQIKAGWYDWFCKDTSLRNKTYKLTGYLKQIVKSKKIVIITYPFSSYYHTAYRTPLNCFKYPIHINTPPLPGSGLFHPQCGLDCFRSHRRVNLRLDTRVLIPDSLPPGFN